MSDHETLLRRILEAFGEPDYNDRPPNGNVLAVWDYRRIPIELIQEARALWVCRLSTKKQVTRSGNST